METASGGMRNPSCVKAVRTTRKQKPRGIVMETTILEILIMTALLIGVAAILHKGCEPSQIEFVFGL